MSAVIQQPYERELRLIANDLVDAAKGLGPAKQFVPTTPKPLSRIQEYLVQLKVCTELTTEWLKEFKELIFVVSVILFFVWGVGEALIKTHL